MGSFTVKEYEYGHPKNEDYAYDTARQREVDEMSDGLGTDAAMSQAQRGVAEIFSAISPQAAKEFENALAVQTAAIRAGRVQFALEILNRCENMAEVVAHCKREAK